MKQKIIYLLFFALLTFCLAATSGQLRAQNLVTTDETEAAIEKAVQKTIDAIDSTAYASRIGEDEFIVRVFRVILKQNPDATRVVTYKSLAAANQLKRSELMALILVGESKGLTAEVMQALIGSSLQQAVAALDKLIANLFKGQLAQVITELKTADSSHLANTPAMEKPVAKLTPPAPVIPYEPYNTYFGLLHSHSLSSDGKGTPLEAYQYARDNGKLDFFGLADHSQYLSNYEVVGENLRWDDLKAAAQATYVPGKFATLWGFEWSNPIFGHVSVINTNDYASALLEFGIDDFYQWLIARPEGFAFFNHPGSEDILGLEFLHLDMLDSKVIPQLVGVETWNQKDGFDAYFYKNNWTDCQANYLDTATQKGWLLGALGNQDNHAADWGTMNQFRTAVLAKRLTRGAIAEAYRARRFYATEDSDLILDFRCQGYPMGSRLTSNPASKPACSAPKGARFKVAARYFTVSASDRGGDTFAEIRFYRNGQLLETRTVSGNSVFTTFIDNNTTDQASYYVVVTQNDDNDSNGRNDEAISSPIWIQ